MEVNGHSVLDFWPIAVVGATGLIAWGRLSHKVDAVKEAVDAKASKEVVGTLDSRLDRMEGKLDRIIERVSREVDAA